MPDVRFIGSLTRLPSLLIPGLAFVPLRQFLTYKGIGAGVEVMAINPRYTSQTCHKCLQIHPTRGESYRSGKSFKCGHCGWHGDADLNGAMFKN